MNRLSIAYLIALSGTFILMVGGAVTLQLEAVNMTRETVSNYVYLPLILNGPALSQPPYTPSNPAPANGAADQPIDLMLSWSGGDPDGDAVSYTVSLGIGSLDIVCQDISVTTCAPDTLVAGTLYSWQVVATDMHGVQAYGPLWTFSTVPDENNPPNTPSVISPSDGASDQQTDIILKWSGGDPDGDTVLYNVTLGSSVDDMSLVCNAVAVEECQLLNLAFGTTYVWQVTATDEYDATTVGTIWTFTTALLPNMPPDVPADPLPEIGAEGQPLTVVLSWTGGDPDGDDVTYDVLAEIGDPTPDIRVAENLSTPSFSLGVLIANAHYQWQVIATDEHGATTLGPVWRFSTLDVGGVSIGMMFVPAGEFQMGCDTNIAEESCQGDELPLHTVYLDEYYIDRHEVSNAQYAQCVASGTCAVPSDSSSFTRPSYYDNPAYADYPVLWSDWNDAQTYCEWAGKRLPTEAEWEKAAQGNDEALRYPWGNSTPTCTVANFFDSNTRSFCVGDTNASTSYPSGVSPFGVLNMSGNVLEWVSDWYQSDYYTISPGSNPTGPVTGTDKVLRGGSWDSGDIVIRSAFRNIMEPNEESDFIGIRCVFP